MDMCAAYHVKKLRWYLLIMLAVGIPISMAMSVINPMPATNDYNKMFLENQEIDWSFAILGNNPEAAIVSLVIYHIVAYGTAVYVIR